MTDPLAPEDRARPRSAAERAGAGAPSGRDPFVPILIGGLVLAVAGFAWLLARIEPPLRLDVGEGATVLAEPIPLPAFELVDHTGRRFDRASLEGRWSLLFFGYSHCPDVCPFVLGQLARVRQAWPEEAPAAMPRVVFVSVDPARDPPERLADWVPFFDAGFAGVTGPADQIERLTRPLGVFHAIREQEGGATGDYLVDHAAKLWLIDPQGRFRAVLDDPHEPEPFIALLGRIRALPGPEADARPEDLS